MSEDDPSAIRRAHNRKRLGRVAGDVDGGAVAVGLVVPLAAFAPTLVLEMPDWVVMVALGAGLFLGGFLARSITTAEAHCPRCHGAYVGVATVVIVGLVVLADTIATGDTVSLEIRTIAGPEPTRSVLAAVVTVAIAGFGGLVGSTRN